METLKFGNSTLFQGLNNAIGNGAANNIGGTGASAFVRIYKGTPLSATAFNGCVTIGDFTTQAASAPLIEIQYTSNAGSLSNNTAKLVDTVYANALNSGVATWFVIFSSPSSSSSSSIYNAFMGTVSDASGNGDLKISSTNIVAGQSYRVNAINLMIPFEFTF